MLELTSWIWFAFNGIIFGGLRIEIRFTSWDTRKLPAVMQGLITGKSTQPIQTVSM